MMTEHSNSSGPSPRRLKAMLQKAAGGPKIVQRDAEGGRYAFVAYARADAQAAAALVAALEARGIAIKWDKNLRGGDNFRKRISELIEGAGAIVVVWSASSVVSDFVIDEAEEGKARGKLITCRLGTLGDGDIPFGFRQLHCVDVADTDAVIDALAVLGIEPARTA